jgi:hypothetical protein
MWFRIALSIAMLIAALLLLPQFQPDYAQDYAAASGWWRGRDTNERTADLLAECCADIAPFYGGMHTAHPPFATLLALPLAWLSWPVARVTWLLLSWAAIAGAWQLARVGPWVCAATASFWILALGLGTHEPLLFLLLALALRIEPGHPRLAAALIGLCAAIKIYPALLIAGLLIAGRRSMALVALASGALALAVCEVVLGLGVTHGWLRFLPINTQFYVDEIGNDSLVRLVRVVMPGAAVALVALIVLALLLLPLIPRIRRGDWLKPLVPVLLLASPLSWRHYMGLTALNRLTLLDQICLGLSGVVALLIGMKLLPTDNMAPVVQGPLLLMLLLLWYRHARARTLPVSAAEPAPQGK